MNFLKNLIGTVELIFVYATIKRRNIAINFKRIDMFKRTAESFVENDEGEKLVYSGIDDGTVYLYLKNGKSISVSTQKSSDGKEITVSLSEELFWNGEKQPIPREEDLQIREKICEAFATFGFKVKVRTLPKIVFKRGFLTDPNYLK